MRTKRNRNLERTLDTSLEQQRSGAEGAADAVPASLHAPLHSHSVTSRRPSPVTCPWRSRAPRPRGPCARSTPSAPGPAGSDERPRLATREPVPYEARSDTHAPRVAPMLCSAVPASAPRWPATQRAPRSAMACAPGLCTADKIFIFINIAFAVSATSLIEFATTNPRSMIVSFDVKTWIKKWEFHHRTAFTRSPDPRERGARTRAVRDALKRKQTSADKRQIKLFVVTTITRVTTRILTDKRYKWSHMVQEIGKQL